MLTSPWGGAFAVDADHGFDLDLIAELDSLSDDSHEALMARINLFPDLSYFDVRH